MDGCGPRLRARSGSQPQECRANCGNRSAHRHGNRTLESRASASAQRSRNPSPSADRGSTPEDLAIRTASPSPAPIRTLVDLACLIDRRPLERAVNEADRLDLWTRTGCAKHSRALAASPGSVACATLLDRRTFRLTDSELERRFLATRPAGRTAAAAHPPVGERLSGRLLLARARPGRRDRWAALPPHARSAGEGSRPRPGPHRRRPHHAAIHPLAGPLRTGAGPLRPSLSVVARLRARRSERVAAVGSGHGRAPEQRADPRGRAARRVPERARGDRHRGQGEADRPALRRRGFRGSR